MFRPVGSEPPSVYWRRRLVLLGGIALVIALIVLTVSTLAGGGGSPQAGRTPTPGTPTPATPTPTTSTPDTSPTTSTSRGTSTAAMPTTCSLSSLQLAARTGKDKYSVGDDVLVELQVVNTGSAPCSRDLSDSQIELRVYNGTSRVWGSHDCATQPGRSVRTLAVGKPYAFEIEWGGLTSGSGCAPGDRQRVGAGSYTLYASLSGKSATAAQFQIS